MARVSSEAKCLFGLDFIRAAEASDVYPSLQYVIDSGWVSDGGAILLAAFRDSYFGERSAFTDTGSYELAVNGRGIPDLDIVVQGVERIRVLMRRGVAFGRAALSCANLANVSDAPVLARVSVAPTLMDQELFTGYVTFFSSRFARGLGAGPDSRLPGIQVVLSSEDCAVRSSDR